MVTCYRCKITEIENAYMYEVAMYTEDWKLISSWNNKYEVKDSGNNMWASQMIRNMLRKVPMTIDYGNDSNLKTDTGRLAFQYEVNKVMVCNLMEICDAEDWKFDDRFEDHPSTMIYKTNFECHTLMFTFKDDLLCCGLNRMSMWDKDEEDAAISIGEIKAPAILISVIPYDDLHFLAGLHEGGLRKYSVNDLTVAK